MIYLACFILLTLAFGLFVDRAALLIGAGTLGLLALLWRTGQRVR